jgi:hypothetical protein
MIDQALVLLPYITYNFSTLNAFFNSEDGGSRFL